MTPEQWHRVKEVFEAALERAPSERSDFLAEACAEDDSLHSEVKSLLSFYGQESEFMETPAAALAHQSLVKEEIAALVGQQLGHYQIEREIGRGGMGVVYLAQDVNLGRPVALKLLPRHLTNDPNRLRRFEREARAASALNHHNILTIYQIAQLDGFHFIATEFIDGVTLRQRIKSKTLTLTEALNIAEQISSALVAAHEAGIVHRDIKPENVMLRRDGYVKVLDFGLAKLTEHDAAETVTASQTAAEGNTDTGVMGTVGYMSPEQAQGLRVDQRADIFSLGVVIYEMLTGQMPIASHSSCPTLEPLPLAHYGIESPRELQLIVSKALSQDREKRYQTTAELLAALRNERSRRTSKSGFNLKTVGVVAVLFAVSVAATLWFFSSRGTAKSSLPAAKVLPFTSFPGSEWLGGFSPDGNTIAFAWTGGENSFTADIYVKQVGIEKPLQLTFGPDQDVCPTWLPDGANVAFLRYSNALPAIYTVPAMGGPESKLLTLSPLVPLCNWDLSPDGKYIAWTTQDRKDEPFRIVLASPETATPRALTSPGAEKFADLNNAGDFVPVFSPDGHSVAFVRQTSFISADIYIVPVTGGEPRRVTSNNTRIAGLTWTADGREIIFSENPALVEGTGTLWRVAVSGGAPERVAIGGYDAMYPHISRRGNRLAYVQGSGDLNIYRLDLSGRTVAKNPPTRFIVSTRNDNSPQYSPDGRRIVFDSDRSGQFEIWMCGSDGTHAVPLTSLNSFAGTPRWSPNGQEIAFDSFQDRKGKIYVISAEGGQPRTVTTGDFNDVLPSWSMDGKWIYFSSNRSGDYEIWKVPSSGGDALQVTRQGGRTAFESPDGNYVYYDKTFPTRGIWRIPMDGGEEVRVLDSFNSELFGDWAIVNEGIYFIDAPDDEVTIKFFGFASEKISEIAKLGKLHMGCPALAVSPNGRQILYSQVDNIGEDIMLVENFR